MLHLNLIRVRSPEEMARAAADMFEDLIRAKPACVLGLATGSTPLPLYRELIAREQGGKIDFSRVRSANLDEYKGLAPNQPQSYRRFMQENLFDHISIKPENTIARTVWQPTSLPCAKLMSIRSRTGAAWTFSCSDSGIMGTSALTNPATISRS